MAAWLAWYPVSHGCVRLDNSAIRWLNVRIGPGLPVTIQS
jgi:lipoprotein-anchoring transpeptidase ErfK/SrfK